MTEHFYEISTIAITATAIGSLVFGIILYLHNAKKQTKNLDNEISNGARPLIKINHMMIARKESKDHIKIWYTCDLENIGSLPSKDIIIKISSSFSPIYKNNFHEFIQDDSKTTLLPGEKYPSSIPLNMEQFNELNKFPLYYGVHVKYYYDDKNQESIGKIFKLCYNGTEILECWNDEPPNIKYD